MITLQNLKKDYAGVEAVRGISLMIPRGQVVGFLGPNGAGKSTTMRMLSGYLKPTSGQVSIAGINVLENPLEARRHIGYLPETNPLYEDMTVGDFLRFVADLRGLERVEQPRLLSQAIERCGLTKVLRRDIGALSKGYRQRVGLAQAIVHEPDVLVLDEATSGLDPNQISEIRTLIKELGQKKTVIMSTHILSEVQSTCSRILVMKNGLLVADATPERLVKEKGGCLYLEVAAKSGETLNNESIIGLLRNLPGVVTVEAQSLNSSDCRAYCIYFSLGDIRRCLFDLVIEQNLILMEMKRQEISLEDAFRKLTSGDLNESDTQYIQA